MAGHSFGKILVIIGLLLVPSNAAWSQTPPVPIIFDTDMAEDVDDTGALALLHALADQGEAQILATIVSARNEFVVPCLDAINTYYDRPDIVIGYVGKAGRPVKSKYVEEVAKRFPHDLKSSSAAPDAVKLYRKILASQPDNSVVIVTVGFLTNLQNLLNTKPDELSNLSGEDLIKKKVKMWVCMGGKFPDGRFKDGSGEYNVKLDTAASVRAMNDWPTPVVFSGFEIGASIKTGERLEETPEDNPVRASYHYYNGLQNRESWDQTAVLYAVRGERDYWSLSEPGISLMHARIESGYNEWIPSPLKQHRYLVEKMPPAKLARIIEELMMQRPKNRKG